MSRTKHAEARETREERDVAMIELGVDFGTTRTVVARVDRGNYPVVSFLDAEGDSRDWFPSVVAERDGALCFGWDALAREAEGHGASVRSWKRLFTESAGGRAEPVRIGEITLPLDELLTRFLSALRAALVERSNLELAPDAELRSVVAVPANASSAQRFATLDAFRRAGFGPAAMLNEPSAAGFEYTHRHRATLTSKRDHVVVYDLGGGTFDASLVRMSGLRHDVVATAGVDRLGGDDFDAALMSLVLAKANRTREGLGPAALAHLGDQCREAKERLHPTSKKLTIEADGFTVSVPVADFYEACAPLVERSMDVMAPVMARIDDDLAGIYVVGGASELPIVTRTLRQRFGRRVHRSPYASAAIAIGLAIACDEGAGYELTDLYARTFGVFRESEGGRGIVFDPIFTEDTPLPSGAGEPLAKRRTYRASHNIGHFRFAECSAVAKDGRPHGDIMVSGDVLFPFEASLARVPAHELPRVPVRRSSEPGRGPRIEETYALDANGLVAVTIRNLDSGSTRVFQLGAG